MSIFVILDIHAWGDMLSRNLTFSVDQFFQFLECGFSDFRNCKIVGSFADKTFQHNFTFGPNTVEPEQLNGVRLAHVNAYNLLKSGYKDFTQIIFDLNRSTPASWERFIYDGPILTAEQIKNFHNYHVPSLRKCFVSSGRLSIEEILELRIPRENLNESVFSGQRLTIVKAIQMARDIYWTDLRGFDLESSDKWSNYLTHTDIVFTLSPSQIMSLSACGNKRFLKVKIIGSFEGYSLNGIIFCNERFYPILPNDGHKPMNERTAIHPAEVTAEQFNGATVDEITYQNLVVMFGEDKLTGVLRAS